MAHLLEPPLCQHAQSGQQPVVAGRGVLHHIGVGSGAKQVVGFGASAANRCENIQMWGLE